jgi:hypothetical protein
MTPTKRPTIAEMEATLDREAAWAEAHYGPQVMGRITGRGRPRKGVEIEPTVPHSIRIQPSLWGLVKAKAKELGISTNAAFQLAVIEWAGRHRKGA